MTAPITNPVPTPELLAYRMALPAAVEAVIRSHEVSRRVALEFAVDLASSRAVERVLWEEMTRLLRLAVHATSVDDLERLLDRRVAEAQTEADGLAADREREALAYLAPARKELAEVIGDAEAPPDLRDLAERLRRLAEAVPALARDNADEVGLELAFCELASSLGLDELIRDEGDDL